MWRRRNNHGSTEKQRYKVLLGLCVFLSLWCIPTAFSHETLTTTVLFDREIVRILNKHCVMCHFEQGPSFPLETYEQTWLLGRKIRADAIARHMPPWPAVPGYGDFANDNSLTLRETQFITSWVEGLGPRNSGTVFTNVVDSAGKPRAAVRAKAEVGKWQLGQPGAVVQFETNTIEAGKGKFVKRSVADTGLKMPRRVRAVEFMPGDRRVVQAVSLTVQETGQWIGSWTPWYGFVSLPSGGAFQLAAGSHIVADIQYRSAKETLTDRGSLGLFFADKPTPNTITDLVLAAKDKGAGDAFRGTTILPADTHAVALHLEMQEGVKSVEVSAKRPDGGTDVLLFAKDFPSDWPTPYIFKEPVLLRRGSTLTVTAHGGSVKLTASRY